MDSESHQTVWAKARRFHRKLWANASRATKDVKDPELRYIAFHRVLQHMYESRENPRKKTVPRRKEK